MNPYEPPKSRLSSRRSGGIHGAMAACLMVLALVLRFGVPMASSSADPGSDRAMFLLLLSFAGGILWVWGCCHLAKHFGLSAVWGLSGLLFLLGPAMIFWAANQKPKWDRAAASQPQGKKREYRGDPNSPY